MTKAELHVKLYVEEQKNIELEADNASLRSLILRMNTLVESQAQYIAERTQRQ